MVSPARSFGADELVGQLDHPLVVGPAHDHGPHAVVEELLEGDDLAADLGAPGHDHVEGLVEDDLLAPDQLVVVELGVEGDPDLAAGREHVDGAVVVAGEERAVGRRRLGELLHLAAQLGDVLARLAEGVGELLVLGDGLGQLALGLQQALLEGAHPLGGVLELAPELDDLLLQHLDLLEQGADLLLVGAQSTFVLGVARVDHLLQPAHDGSSRRSPNGCHGQHTPDPPQPSRFEVRAMTGR